MDADEREIFNFLKTWGTEYINPKEIAKRAGNRKRYYDDPDWAKPVLMRMADRGMLESDMQGRYRVKPLSRRDKNKHVVPPDIAKILQESGLDIEETRDEAIEERGEMGSETAAAEPPPAEG